MGKVAITLCLVLVVSKYALAKKESNPDKGEHCDERRTLTLQCHRHPVSHKIDVGANQVIVDVNLLPYPTPSPDCIRGKSWTLEDAELTVKWNCSGTFEICIKNCDERRTLTLHRHRHPVTHGVGANQAIVNVKLLHNQPHSPDCIRGKSWLHNDKELFVKWNCSGTFEICIKNTDPTQPDTTTKTSPVTISGHCDYGSVQANKECTGYFTCIGEQLRVLKLCPGNLKYSAKQEKCVDPKTEPFYCDSTVHFHGTGSSTVGQKTTETTPPTGHCYHGSVWANEDCTGYFACIGTQLSVLQLCPANLKYSAKQEKCVDPQAEPYFYCDTRVQFPRTGSSTVGQQTTGTTPPTDELDCDLQKTVFCGTSGQGEKTCDDLLDKQEAAIICASVIQTAPYSICEPERDWFYDQSSITVLNGCSATFDLCIKNCDEVKYLTCDRRKCFTYTEGKIIRAERKEKNDYCKGKFMFGDKFIEIADPACKGSFWLCIAHEHK